MKRGVRRVAVLEIEITVNFDAHAAEALWLELRRLAKRYGAVIEEFRIVEVAGDLK